MPVRVVLVEDNDVFREALEVLLGLEPRIEVVGSTASGEEAVALALCAAPDVVLMDYRLPGGTDGVEATAALRAACPGVAVVCLTASASPKEMGALEAAGAVACLTKDQALPEIVAAVRRAGGDP